MEIKIFVLRVVLALGLGALIGIERELKQRSAGLITNALVSVGAAIYILISIKLWTTSGGDSSRVIAQVVTGIGFLGAGVIMRDGFSVFGLNSAATIWCSAAVGSLCGFGYWEEAIFCAVLLVSAHLIFRVILHFVSRFSFKIPRTKNIGYIVLVNTKIQHEQSIRSTFIEELNHYNKFLLRLLKTKTDKENNAVEIRAEILSYGRQSKEIEAFVSELAKIPEVNDVGWEILKQTFD